MFGEIHDIPKKIGANPRNLEKIPKKFGENSKKIQDIPCNSEKIYKNPGYSQKSWIIQEIHENPLIPRNPIKPKNPRSEKSRDFFGGSKEVQENSRNS